MIGIVIVAHAPLASALAAVARHVYSRTSKVPCTHFEALDVDADADVDAAVQHARDLRAAVDDGSGVLVLTDTLGATPGNVATRLAEPGRIAVVAGISLPMLLRALSNRGGVLAEAVDKAMAGGTHGITQFSATPTRQDQKQNVRGDSPGDDLARIQDQQ